MTEREFQRLQARTTPPKRPRLRLGAHRPAFSSVAPTPTGYVFTWIGWLPKLSNHYVHWRARARLSKLTRQVFGVLPPFMQVQRRAKVEVIRVLGPGQKPIDRDSLAQMVAGCLDGIQPSYLYNDSEKWADVTYSNDGTRRDYGPCIEIILIYETDGKGTADAADD